MAVTEPPTRPTVSPVGIEDGAREVRVAPAALLAAAQCYAAAAVTATDAAGDPSVEPAALGTTRVASAWQRVVAARAALLPLAVERLRWSEHVLRDAARRYDEADAAVATAAGGGGGGRVLAR